MEEPFSNEFSSSPLLTSHFLTLSCTLSAWGTFQSPSCLTTNLTLWGSHLRMSAPVKMAQHTLPQLTQEAVCDPTQVTFAFTGVPSPAQETAEQLQAAGGLTHNPLALSI